MYNLYHENDKKSKRNGKSFAFCRHARKKNYNERPFHCLLRLLVTHIIKFILFLFRSVFFSSSLRLLLLMLLLSWYSSRHFSFHCVRMHLVVIDFTVTNDSFPVFQLKQEEKQQHPNRSKSEQSNCLWVRVLYKFMLSRHVLALCLSYLYKYSNMSKAESYVLRLLLISTVTTAPTKLATNWNIKKIENLTRLTSFATFW